MRAPFQILDQGAPAANRRSDRSGSPWNLGLYRLCLVAAAWTLIVGEVFGEMASGTSTNSPSAAMPMRTNVWAFSATAYTYFVPDARDYVQPTFTADYGWLHLEGRYNYEDLETGSAWVGYNLAGGRAVTWELTPMLGGVFGNTTGIAPGWKGSLGWRRFELYSEGEAVFDTGDWAKSYFYNWSELTFSPVDWFRFGLVTQRTRAYQAEREVQPGLLLGFTWRSFDLTACVFNPDEGRPILAFAVGVGF